MISFGNSDLPTSFAHNARQSEIELSDRIVDASQFMIRFWPTRNIFVQRCDQTHMRFHRQSEGVQTIARCRLRREGWAGADPLPEQLRSQWTNRRQTAPLHCFEQARNSRTPDFSQTIKRVFKYLVYPGTGQSVSPADFRVAQAEKIYARAAAASWLCSDSGQNKLSVTKRQRRQRLLDRES